eukprot:g37729.t1
MAKEEFGIMLCPKFVQVGTQRNIAEAFAEYRTFSIGERKVRKDGEYPTGGEVGRGVGVRGKRKVPEGHGIFELLHLVGLDARKEKKKFLVSMTNEPEDEVELRSSATLSQRVAMLLERQVESVHTTLHGTERGSQDAVRTAVCGTLNKFFSLFRLYHHL